jgi:hypothetical protein
MISTHSDDELCRIVGQQYSAVSSTEKATHQPPGRYLKVNRAMFVLHFCMRRGDPFLLLKLAAR